jgi:hypothetical protein
MKPLADMAIIGLSVVLDGSDVSTGAPHVRPPSSDDDVCTLKTADVTSSSDQATV